MSSKRQRDIPLGGRYRQVSLYIFEQDTCTLVASSHGNASRVTGHPWGESTGYQWTTSLKASNILHGPRKSCGPNSWGVHAELMSHYHNGAWAGLMWSILWLDSYPNIAWHPCGLHIYGWRNTFAPSDTYWMNNVTDWTSVHMAHHDHLKLRKTW